MSINETTILNHAKNLAKEDGFEWEVELKRPLPKATKIPLKPILDEDGRQKYLSRARDALRASAT